MGVGVGEGAVVNEALTFWETVIANFSSFGMLVVRL